VGVTLGRRTSFGRSTGPSTIPNNPMCSSSTSATNASTTTATSRRSNAHGRPESTSSSLRATKAMAGSPRREASTARCRSARPTPPVLSKTTRSATSSQPGLAGENSRSTSTTGRNPTSFQPLSPRQRPFQRPPVVGLHEPLAPALPHRTPPAWSRSCRPPAIATSARRDRSRTAANSPLPRGNTAGYPVWLRRHRRLRRGAAVADRPPYFEVTQLSHNGSTTHRLGRNDPVAFNATIRNVGNVTDSQLVLIFVDGERVGARRVTLGGTESATIHGIRGIACAAPRTSSIRIETAQSTLSIPVDVCRT